MAKQTHQYHITDPDIQIASGQDQKNKSEQ